MEPEIIQPAGNRKKILIVTLLVVLAVVGVALVYLFMQKDTPGLGTEMTPVVQEEKVYTQAEKEQILAQLASSLPKDLTTVTEKTRILKDISKKLPTSTLSDAGKLVILEALASSTVK